MDTTNKYISVGLGGGLGNYLFQIATAYSKSIDEESNLIVDIDDIYVGQNQVKFDFNKIEDTNTQNSHNNPNVYKNNIFRNIKFGFLDNFNIYNEKEFKYNKLPTFNENTKLSGYFQSEKYFLHNRDKVLELYSIDDESNKKIIDKYGKILSENTCSIHVRRGDYLILPHHHPTCNTDYYNEAIKQFPEETFFLVFSDDIDWCKTVFNGNNFTFIEGNEDYIDLWLMSLCKNNIIANSTFSWWGAWLNQNLNKKVIVPPRWFGPAINHNTKDLIPNSWVII